MKKKNKIYTVSIPKVSLDFAKYLDTAFPELKIKPGVTLDEKMYNAGQREVVDFIRRVATGTVVSGDESDTRGAKEAPKSLLKRLIGS